MWVVGSKNQFQKKYFSLANAQTYYTNSYDLRFYTFVFAIFTQILKSFFNAAQHAFLAVVFVALLINMGYVILSWALSSFIYLSFIGFISIL